MANIVVNVANTLTGEEFECTVPDDTKVEDLFPILVDRMEAGDPPNDMTWQLENRTQKFAYSDSDTLAKANTETGDNLVLATTNLPG